MSEQIDAATHFNRAVESTAVVGGLVAGVAAMKGDILEMKADAKETRGDVKHIRTTIDHWAGRATVIGALISFMVSIVVAVYGQPIAHAIATAITR